MENFEFGDGINVDKLEITTADIADILPYWRTKILGVYTFQNSKLFELSFAIAAKTEQDVKQWIHDYEEKSKCTYSIRSSHKCTGSHVQFKQQLHCQHNTKSKATYDPSTPRQRTRNTNCPSSIGITLRTVHKRYQGKDKSKAPIPDMPCEIRLIPTHNHATLSAHALRFRAVSAQTRQTLLTYFENGHSPATARDSLKMELQLKYQDNYQEIWADRSVCPDYMYIYHLYTSVFKKTNSPIEATREVLKQKIEEYNKDGNYAGIQFFEEDYVICLCPPLMKRVHENIAMASDMVFIDSRGTADHNEHCIFVLSTTSDSLRLPLAVIITSSESANFISSGFELLKNIMGDSIFGGNKAGPNMFISNDSAAGQAAIKSAFPESNCVLCIFDVLKSVLRWLIKPKNHIHQDSQHIFFTEFRAIMYAPNETECQLAYKTALCNGKKYPNYQNYLREFWERRSLWASCYRNDSGLCDNISEAAMRLLKETIFERIKAFNLVSVVDFMLSKFVNYYEKILLDAAHNRTKNFLYDTIKMPSQELLQQIEHVTDSIQLVPRENKNVKNSNVKYMVNSEVLVCTCNQGRTEYICKHIYWICFSVKSEHFVKRISSEGLRRKIYFIATGAQPPPGWLQPLFFDAPPSRENEQTTRALDVDHELDHNCTLNDDVLDSESIIDDSEPLIIEGTREIKRIQDKLTHFLAKSPLKVNKALAMLNRNLQATKTVAEFTSACNAFSSGINQPTKKRKIPIKPTTITIRKASLSANRKNVLRRRKNTKF